jgi:type IV secretory pathway VirB2 component (pilin)
MEVVSRERGLLARHINWLLAVVVLLEIDVSLASAQDADPVKGSLMQVIQAIRGGWGDAVVIGCFVLCLLAAYRKMPRVAGGFFVLLLGTVLIRVLISMFF